MKLAFIALVLVAFQVTAFALPALDPDIAINSFSDVWSQLSRQCQNTWVEQLGEAGGRTYAESQGWLPLFSHSDGGIPQGFDQVYVTETGSIVAIEVKGGVSRLQVPRCGYAQGTIEYTLDAASRLLHSPSATPQQIQAAREVLRSGTRGDLQSLVVRTPHINGQPTSVSIEHTYTSNTHTRQMAQELIDELASEGVDIYDDIARSADEVLGAAVPIQGNSQGFSESSGQLDEVVQNSLDDLVNTSDDVLKKGIEAIDDPRLILGEQIDDGVFSITSNVDDVARSVNASRMARVGGFLKRAAPVVAAAFFVADGYFMSRRVFDIKEELDSGIITIPQFETQIAQEVGGFAGAQVGGWTSAIAVGWLGAKTGGALSGVLGGPWAGVAGGIIGGVAGGYFGYKYGEEAGLHYADQVTNQLRENGIAWGETASQYLSVIQPVWTEVDYSLSYFAAEVELKLNAIADQVERGTVYVWSNTEYGAKWSYEQLEYAGTILAEGAEITWNGIEYGADWTGQQIAVGAYHTYNKACEVALEVEEGACWAYDKVEVCGAVVAEFTEETIEQISATAPVVIDSIEEVIDEIGSNE